MQVPTINDFLKIHISTEFSFLGNVVTIITNFAKNDDFFHVSMFDSQNSTFDFTL